MNPMKIPFAPGTRPGNSRPMPREPWTPEEKLEADLLAEEFTGQPVNYGSTAKAIAALEQRLAYLRAIPNPLPATLGEIRTAEADLARYRQQQQGRN